MMPRRLQYITAERLLRLLLKSWYGINLQVLSKLRWIWSKQEVKCYILRSVSLLILFRIRKSFLVSERNQSFYKKGDRTFTNCIQNVIQNPAQLCGNKMPTRCNRWYLLQILLHAQHVSGQYYAHHQELESIIQMVAACGIWCFGFQVVGMVSLQTGHITSSSTPYRQPENQSTKYHRQRPSV